MSETARTQAALLLETAADNFDQAIATMAPVYFAVLGLDAIAQAASICVDLTDVAPSAVARIQALGFDVVVKVFDAVRGQTWADEVPIAFGVVSALLKPEDDPLRGDRLLFVVMVLNNLRSHLCRTELHRRGDRLTRMALARRAWNAAHPSELPLQ